MRSFNIKIILFFLSLIFSFSNAQAIYGGEPIHPMMRKSIVNIKLKLGMCSGVLIAPNVVITAAHCKDMSRKPEFVSWLDGDRKKKKKKCDTSVVTDFAYLPTAERIFPRKVHSPDILLLKIEKPLCSAVPAKIQSEPLIAGDELLQTGYGGRGGAGLFFDAHQIALKMIETPLNPRELTTTDSKFFLDLLDLADRSYLFALPINQGDTACTGDSGGPLFYNENGKMLLYGVNGAVFPHTELGSSKCNNGYLHLITPIAPYYEWMQSMIKQWSA